MTAAASLIAADFAGGFESGPLTGAAVFLGIAALVQHVNGSRITLREEKLVVIDPLMTHTAPHTDIART
ncbi:hypothetical protein [Streptomyces sp. bgisy060]|uniref:hypothetical protein n=1 Tax=Streptomyces sp. bgisy060 TaxID=3413775 RepID=UPI003EC06CF7